MISFSSNAAKRAQSPVPSLAQIFVQGTKDDNTTRLIDLVKMDSLISVRPQREIRCIYEYLLFKVLCENPLTITEDVTDDYGNTFTWGSTVQIGIYFDYQKEMKAGAQYKLNKQKNSYIYAYSVLYVGINLTEKRTYMYYLLSNNDHQDIMSVLF